MAITCIKTVYVGQREFLFIDFEDGNPISIPIDIITEFDNVANGGASGR